MDALLSENARRRFARFHTLFRLTQGNEPKANSPCRLIEVLGP